VLVYDNNHITIEGQTSLAFTEDVAVRFLGYGWNVLRSRRPTTSTASNGPSASSGRRRAPTLLILDTHIGYGAPHKHDTAAAHGEPLGRQSASPSAAYGWPEEAQFLVPDGVREHFDGGRRGAGSRGSERLGDALASYRSRHPELATEIEEMQGGPAAGWDRNLPVFPADGKGVAGRDASGKVLNVLAQSIPWFLGGSAISARRTRRP